MTARFCAWYEGLRPFTPAPPDELGGISVPVLAQRKLPNSVRAYIEIARPLDAMATFSERRARENLCIT